MSAKQILFVSVILGASVAPAAAEVIIDAPTARPPHSCGTRQAPIALASDSTPGIALAPGGQRTIYLNKNGGTYRVINGATSSATNTATANVSAAGTLTAVIPPVSNQFNWPVISACVVDYFRPYNIRVVESEPTSGLYVEAVVGGFGTELGFGANQLFGIAAADNFCGVTEAGIAFSFSEPHRNVPERDAELCATIAHEVGHLLALEHAALSTDLMSYVLVSDTSSKAFVDQFGACGTGPQDQMQCTCTGGQTNSYQRLVAAIGTRPTETVPPTISVVSPGDRATVAPAFEVVAKATDDMGMSDVYVTIDGIQAGASETPAGDSYTVKVTGLTEGAHVMSVVARDLAGNTTAAQRTLTVAKLGFGETCLDSSACAGNMCAMTADGDAFCTQTCDLAGGGTTCPADSTCTAAGASAVCVPDAGGGCGCTSTSPGDGLGALLMLGLGLVVSRGRRRARVADLG